jgi:hypothetical protein
VPSVSRQLAPLAVAVLCGAIAAGGLAGCETTQEKAAAQRAEAERILGARKQRQQKKHEHGNRQKEKG